MPMTQDIRFVKRARREKYKNLRRSMSADEKNCLDRKISDRLKNLWAYRESEIVLTYVSTAIEVDTLEIINYSLKCGKRVAVPRCVEGTRNMEFFFIDSADELSPGSFNVLEPPRNEEKKLTDYSSGLCIVPALAFSSDGYRLGYGKGYYDRFLSVFSGNTIGFCYSSCVCESLPHGKYDRKVSTVITDKGVMII